MTEIRDDELTAAAGGASEAESNLHDENDYCERHTVRLGAELLPKRCKNCYFSRTYSGTTVTCTYVERKERAFKHPM